MTKVVPGWQRRSIVLYCCSFSCPCPSSTIIWHLYTTCTGSCVDCAESRHWSRTAGKCSGSLPVTSYQWLTSVVVALLRCTRQSMPVHCWLPSSSTTLPSTITQVHGLATVIYGRPIE